MPAIPAATAIATLGGEAMGTTWRVRVVAARDADLHAMHAGIQSQLDLVVRQMSTWETGSDISRYNRAAAGRWVRVPDAFACVLGCALAIAEASDGAFDPTVGALVAAWGFGADAHECVPASEPRRAEARRNVGWRRIAVRDNGREVLQPGRVRLDLSAIAKGYGADLVAGWLRETGVAGALVEVGGELFGYGRKPDGEAWRVLVEAGPEQDDHMLPPRVLQLDGIGVASSGDRWHHYTRADDNGDERRYTHTIDPRSGEPMPHAPVAVTVLADDAMQADGWATALGVLGSEAGMALAERQGLAVRYLLRDGSGELHERMTDAFRARLVE